MKTQKQVTKLVKELTQEMRHKDTDPCIKSRNLNVLMVLDRTMGKQPEEIQQDIDFYRKEEARNKAMREALTWYLK